MFEILPLNQGRIVLGKIVISESIQHPISGMLVKMNFSPSDELTRAREMM